MAWTGLVLGSLFETERSRALRRPPSALKRPTDIRKPHSPAAKPRLREIEGGFDKEAGDPYPVKTIGHFNFLCDCGDIFFELQLSFAP